MKRTFYVGIILFTVFNPINIFCQVVPSLGAAASFAVFTGIGAINNTALTNVDGSIGSNAGAYTGDPPIITNGQLHMVDSITNQANIDLNIAYSFLVAMTPDTAIGSTLGNGQILTSHIYSLNAASVLSGDLLLDAKGNPNAIFIFKIDGALSASVSSHIILLNSASLCNVYWQVNGAFDLGSNSVFKGTLLANGAISLLANSSFVGHCFATTGAITLNSNQIVIGISPTVITPIGPTTFLQGDSVILSANISTSYLWSTLATTQNITVYTSGNYSVTVTNLNSCTGTYSINTLVVDYLPIKLLNFSAEAMHNQIELKWSTASEINSDSYEIERSFDGISYDFIKSIKAFGNTNQRIDYAVNDAEPLQGISYYRLKQIDFDKHFVYSPTISVEMKMELDFEFQVFPNPVTTNYCKGNFKCESGQTISIILKDIFGKTLYSKNVVTENSNYIFYPIENLMLVNGIYLINVSCKNKSYSKTIIIQ